MQTKIAFRISSTGVVSNFELPGEDVEMFVHHLKDMDDPSLYIIDQSVVHVGKFHGEDVKRWITKCKKQYDQLVIQ